MKQPYKLLIAGFCAVAFAVAALCPQTLKAQAEDEQQQIAKLVSEISQQQTQIVANQKLIDDKVAVVAESLRVAKIFVSRGGGASK